MNRGSLTAHENACEHNPNRVRQVRSPLAGAKKSCTTWNTGKKTGPHENWAKKFPDDVVFAENSTYNRASLKKRILRDDLIKYECDCCGIGPMWQGKPMTLILDHINGINNDNRLLNLRFVCSNCDSQLPTYKARNKAKKKVLEG